MNGTQAGAATTREDFKRARAALSKNIKLLRVTRGWSQEVLAEVSGLHRTYISMIERQDKNVGLDNLERLAEAFGVSIGELVDWGQ